VELSKGRFTPSRLRVSPHWSAVAHDDKVSSLPILFLVRARDRKKTHLTTWSEWPMVLTGRSSPMSEFL